MVKSVDEMIIGHRDIYNKSTKLIDIIGEELSKEFRDCIVERGIFPIGGVVFSYNKNDDKGDIDFEGYFKIKGNDNSRRLIIRDCISPRYMPKITFGLMIDKIYSNFIMLYNILERTSIIDGSMAIDYHGGIKFNNRSLDHVTGGDRIGRFVV